MSSEIIFHGTILLNKNNISYTMRPMRKVRLQVDNYSYNAALKLRWLGLLPYIMTPSFDNTTLN